MKHKIICAAIVAISTIASGQVFADSDNSISVVALIGAALRGTQAALAPTLTGQPDQSCDSETAPNTPGQSPSAPGSAFNPAGQAGSVYGGEQPQNSRNPVSVSQYDVACFEQPVF